VFFISSNMILIDTVAIPDAQGWTQELYLTDAGDYYVALLKYGNCKADEPYMLLPAGDN